MRLQTCLCFLLVRAVTFAQSEPESQENSRKGSIFGLPVVYNTPETSWAFGLAGIYSFYTDRNASDTATRPSQMQLALVYTLNRQLLFYTPFDVFTPANKLRFNGEIGYYKYTYFFFGNGNGWEGSPGELYEATYPRMRVNALKKTGDALYLGMRYWVENYRITRREAGGLLEGDAVPGAMGGLVSGLGPALQIDSRDQLFYPRRGNLLESALIFNGRAFGSQYNFIKYLFNGSKYFPMRRNMVLAVNAYLEYNTGDVPFYQMGLLGGGRRLRGYFEGRYRDKMLMILQAEWRFPLWKRFKGAIFGGAGVVADRPAALDADYLRPAYGVGLRYLALRQQQVHLRFDLAWGQKDSGFYLTVGEAF